MDDVMKKVLENAEGNIYFFLSQEANALTTALSSGRLNQKIRTDCKYPQSTYQYLWVQSRRRYKFCMSCESRWWTQCEQNYRIIFHCYGF
jgi:hypothetical protein